MRVIFEPTHCEVQSLHDNHTFFIGSRNENVYLVDLDSLNNSDVCLASLVNDSWLWHRWLGHAGMKQISKLVKIKLFRRLPKLKFEKDDVCDACQMRKQTRSSFKSKGMISTSRPLELLHFDLFGPISPSSLGGKSYAFIIVDDYSRFT